MLFHNEIMKKNKVDWRLVAVGMVCLTAAEMYALFNGINGTLFSVYVFIIAPVFS